MALVSSPVASGQDILSLQYNKLRQDLLDNHAHISGGGEGGIISHADLSDGAVAPNLLTHANISEHITGSETGAFEDAGGGNVGVHGLDLTGYVAGVAGTVAQTTGGSATLSAHQLIMLAGVYTPSGSYATSFTVSFPAEVEFSSPPVIILTFVKPGTKLANDWEVALGTVGTTSFVVHQSDNYAPGANVSAIHWLAIGEKASS